MKIRQQDHLGLIFREVKQIKDIIAQYHLDESKYPLLADAEWREGRKNILDGFFDDKKFKDYIITKKAREIAQKVRIGAKFNYKLLNTVKEQNSSYLLDDKRFFRFFVKDGSIYVFYLNYEPQISYMNYESFRIDTVTGELLNVSERAYDLAEELIRYIIFVNLSEVEYKIVPAGRKVGTRLNGYKNDSPFNVTVVDSDWNKFVIRKEGFAVSGHLRLQAHGPERGLRKLVWIDGYEKSGYIRTPKKVSN